MDGRPIFPLSRGVRQGCPLSSYLFLLCAEILGSAIRNDNVIRGFKVLDTESKISQYADDTTLILDGSESSFSRSLSILDSFALISGLKVNYEKTEALWIGPYKNSESAISSSKPILWAKDKVYALGIWFSTSNDAYLNTNFTEKINKLQSILNNWSAKRHPTRKDHHLKIIGDFTNDLFPLIPTDLSKNTARCKHYII